MFSFFAHKEPGFIRRLRGRLVAGTRRVSIGRGCLLSRVGFSEGVTIEDYVRLLGSPQIVVGRDVYINCYTMISGEILIEDHVMISQYVNVWGRAHRFAKKDLLIWDQYGIHGVTDQGYDVQPVRICRGAWIGPHVTISRGVTIGVGAVIGANAMVTKDIPDFGVAFGVPAKVVKFRQ